MADEENGGHQNLPAEPAPEDTDLVPSTDMLYMRMEEVASGLLSFYEMVATAPPEVIEAFIVKYPLTAAAKLRVAPIALSKVLPVKKQVQVSSGLSRRRLPPTALLKMGVGTGELRKLAGMEEK